MLPFGLEVGNLVTDLGNDNALLISFFIQGFCFLYSRSTRHALCSILIFCTQSEKKRQTKSLNDWEK